MLWKTYEESRALRVGLRFRRKYEYLFVREGCEVVFTCFFKDVWCYSCTGRTCVLIAEFWQFHASFFFFFFLLRDLLSFCGAFVLVHSRIAFVC